MLFKSILATALLQLLGVQATWTAYEEYLSSIPSKADGKRPEISFEPNQPWEAFPESPARHKTCKVKSHDDMKTDDSAYILDALHECNHGGRVVFPAGKTYVIGKALNMQFLKHVDVGTCKNGWHSSNSSNDKYSGSGLHPVHQRYRLLASEQLQANLPKRNHLLPARWYGCQRLWRWYA